MTPFYTQPFLKGQEAKSHCPAEFASPSIKANPCEAWTGILCKTSNRVGKATLSHPSWSTPSMSRLTRFHPGLHRPTTCFAMSGTRPVRHSVAPMYAWKLSTHTPLTWPPTPRPQQMSGKIRGIRANRANRANEMRMRANRANEICMTRD